MLNRTTKNIDNFINKPTYLKLQKALSQIKLRSCVRGLAYCVTRARSITATMLMSGVMGG